VRRAGADHGAVRSLSRDQVREVDRIAIEELGLSGPILMENAGRGAAEAVRAAVASGELRTASWRPPTAVLLGGGNNAGDGYVLARHLSNAGWPVLLVETAPPERLSPDAALFRAVTAAMGLPHRPAPSAAAFEALGEELAACELLVDALLGTGFRGEVREPLAGIIAAANELRAGGRRPLVALDTPSGLDVDSGLPSNATVRADLTLTFVAPKPGFAAARAWTGRVRCIAIGAPPGLAERVL